MLWVYLCACLGSSPDWIERFKEDSDSVVQSLILLDPVERLAIVQRLQEEFPGETSILCDALDGSARSYCLERDLRPHLWMPQKELSNAVSSQSISSSNCSNQACRIEEAFSFALRGKIDDVLSICNGDHSAQSHECLFMVAEKIVSSRGINKYDTAVDICQQAASFSQNCQNHLIQQLAQGAPDSDTTSDWSDIFQAQRAIETTWGWRDKEQRDRLQERLWSEAIVAGFAGADLIVGNSLDILPPEARVHIHSAAAWKLFQVNDPRTRTLDEWSTELYSNLLERSEKSPSLDQQRRFRAASDLWDSTSQEMMSTSVYLSTSKRWTSKDDLTDITIAVLEAVARHPPVKRSILEEGIHHKDRVVQITSQRLLSRLQRSNDLKEP